MARHTPPRTRRARARGFTLIEAALTTVIVGVGVLAMMQAQQAYHMKNNWAQRTGTGQLLANEIRELTMTLPMHDPLSGQANMGPETGEGGIDDYDDLDDFDGAVFNPPVNALGIALDDLGQWSQVVALENVPENNMDMASPTGLALGSTELIRVTVTVLYQDPQEVNPRTITSLRWVVHR